MNLNDFLSKLKTSPESIEFTDSMSVIEANYDYQPAAFSNGSTSNAAGTNEGSCKIFAFAGFNSLNKHQTLALFGKYYREDVLQHPENDDHANIRQFMQHGWEGIHFDCSPLKPKP